MKGYALRRNRPQTCIPSASGQALNQRPVRCAVGNDSDFRLAVRDDLWARNEQHACSNFRLMCSMFRSKSCGAAGCCTETFIVPVCRARSTLLRCPAGCGSRCRLRPHPCNGRSQPVQMLSASPVLERIRHPVIPRSRSDITNTSVWNCSARLNASVAMSKHSDTEFGIHKIFLVSPRLRNAVERISPCEVRVGRPVEGRTGCPRLRPGLRCNRPALQTRHQ